jgi:hypothetical protein
VKGDAIFYSTIAIQRRADLYPSPSPTFAPVHIFSPDGWEHWQPKPWQYVPFNGGPRICVGQNFTLTEMAYVLVRLVQRFDRLEGEMTGMLSFIRSRLSGHRDAGSGLHFLQARNDCKTENMVTTLVNVSVCSFPSIFSYSPASACASLLPPCTCLAWTASEPNYTHF